jgi:hypothetical protein
MIDRPQRASLSIGLRGCYFLSILHLAEETAIARSRPDPLVEYSAAVQAGTLGGDCMVLDAGRLLSGISGIAWTCIKAGPGHDLPVEYVCKSGEREILRYERPSEPGDSSGTERAHFVVGDGRGNLAWDPWGDSHTVAVGQVVSKRIFRRA